MLGSSLRVSAALNLGWGLRLCFQQVAGGAPVAGPGPLYESTGRPEHPGGSGKPGKMWEVELGFTS